MLYPVHFLFFRILPKLPVIGNLYALITNGKNRFLSKAEVFGRLSYCGFSIQSSIEINNYIYFIARSVKTESREVNPTLGAVIKLNRIGYGGYNIGIYKFRTMHPYSEFLQSSLYEEGRLNEDGDKINNDFRVTKWGKVLRKLWIDELPQLINWVQGDLNLVGVRALSPAKLDLYPPDLKEMRTKIKPGIIPPFYADIPNDFEGLLDSERKYLRRKMSNKFSTDIMYFFRISYNIIFKGARSE